MSYNLTCGEALVALLEKYDVETVFGIPGVHTVELYRGLAGSDINHVLTRHEQGAAFMADGYARAANKPGVCFVITGPGVTNAATAIGQAYADSIPMLIISSDNVRPSLGKGWGNLHEVTDQQRITEPITAFSATAGNPGDIPDLIARAFTVFASARPRPVHISIPLDILAERVEGEWQKREMPAAPAPPVAQIEQAVHYLKNAKRPALIIGGGAAPASASLVQIAERLAAGVLATTGGKGIVPDSHPLSLGANLGKGASLEYLRKADIVLAIGTELAETDHYSGGLPLAGKLIRVDLDPSKLTDLYPPLLAICSDAAAAAEMIAAELDDLQREGDKVEAELAAIRADNYQFNDPIERQHLRVLEALRRVLPADGYLYTDMTQLAYTAKNAWRSDMPRRHHHPTGFGALGYAVPAAIGGKVGQPDKAVAAIVGDHGILYTGQAMAVAVELGLSLPIILWHNDMLGAIVECMTDNEVPPIAVRQRNPDYIALAGAFGCHTSQPNSAASFEAALSAAFVADAPTLIQLKQDDAWLME